MPEKQQERLIVLRRTVPNGECGKMWQNVPQHVEKTGKWNKQELVPRKIKLYQTTCAMGMQNRLLNATGLNVVRKFILLSHQRVQKYFEFVEIFSAWRVG